MATLTLQVRLGISRGWRVRTLNNVKFYNQAIAHCLFIFSSLRARGYKDRIWTMNYTVFASGSKYSIYVEYFLLPDHSSWKRGIQQYFCSTYTLGRSAISGQIRPGYGFNLVFKGTPHLRRVANIRRSSRKQSVQSINTAIWAWASRARLLDVMHRGFLLSNDSTRSFEMMNGWASSLAAKFTGVDLINPVAPHTYTKKYINISRAAWRQFKSRVTSLSKNSVRLFLRARRRNLLGHRSKLKNGFRRVTARLIRKMGRSRDRLRLTYRTRQRLIGKTRRRLARFLMVCAARRLLWAQSSWSGNSVRSAWPQVSRLFTASYATSAKRVAMRRLGTKKNRNTRSRFSPRKKR